MEFLRDSDGAGSAYVRISLESRNGDEKQGWSAGYAGRVLSSGEGPARKAAVGGDFRRRRAARNRTDRVSIYSAHSISIETIRDAGCTGSCWKKPGPVAGPYFAYPVDGSKVTYYWHRFADQPALLNADLTGEEREARQTRWKNSTRPGRWTVTTCRHRKEGNGRVSTRLSCHSAQLWRARSIVSNVEKSGHCFI